MGQSGLSDMGHGAGRGSGWEGSPHGHCPLRSGAAVPAQRHHPHSGATIPFPGHRGPPNAAACPCQKKPPTWGAAVTPPWGPRHLPAPTCRPVPVPGCYWVPSLPRYPWLIRHLPAVPQPLPRAHQRPTSPLGKAGCSCPGPPTAPPWSPLDCHPVSLVRPHWRGQGTPQRVGDPGSVAGRGGDG